METPRPRLDAILASLRGNVLKPLAARATGDRTYRALVSIEASLALPADQMRREAERRLRAILVHARETAPFHRERMRAARFDPEVARLPEDLRTLPPMTRREITDHARDLLSAPSDGTPLLQFRSGGTTSAPVAFGQTRGAVAEKDAAAFALKRRMGWQPGDRAAALWGAVPDMPSTGRRWLRGVKRAVRDAFLGDSLWLPASDLSDARLDEYVERLCRFRPRALQGYPSAVDLLARRARARGIALSVPIVLLTAEPVLAEHRRRIADALSARVFSFYGARECGWIASESASCPRLHVNTAGVYLEAEPDGRLLVTDLVNRSMPFLRYEIGDLGAIDSSPCSCGDPRPVLARLEGRQLDMFTLPSGRRVPGVLPDVRGIGLDAEGILDAQLVQPTISTLDVLYVPGPRFRPEHVARFREHLNHLFSGELRITFHETQRIEPGPNGKVRYCISRVTEAARR